MYQGWPATNSVSFSTTPGASDNDASRYTDQNDTWVDRRVHPLLQPYLKLVRIDRPIGTWLVLLPGWWGVAMCSMPGQLPNLTLMAIFGAGAFLMRGAGCTMNDMWDRHFDAQVARTRQRPLASGKISGPAALAFLAAQLSASLSLLLQLPPPAIQLGFGAVFLAAVYPAMKRITHFPQAVLGLTMNYGVLMAWATTTGWAAEAVSEHGGESVGAAAREGGVMERLSTLTEQVSDPSLLSALLQHGGLGAELLPAILPLYAGAACWTIVYDTLYAHQDKSDDAKLGLRSTALWMGDATPAILTGTALVAGGAWTAAGLASGMAWPYFAGVSASAGHMLWQSRTARLDDRENLTNRFTSNTYVGWMMLAGIVGGKMLA